MQLNYFVLFKRFVLVLFFYSSAKLWLLVPFTWANRLVHGLQFGQMERKIQTGKFRPGIAFTIRTNQFHLPKNDREGMKLVTKMFRRNGTRISFWNSLSGKTGQPFQKFRCSRKVSAETTQRAKYSSSNRIFRKLFLKGKQRLLPFRVVALFIIIFLFTILLGSKRV